MGKDLKGKEIGKGIIQKKNGQYEARYVNRFGQRKSVSGRDLKDVKDIGKLFTKTKKNSTSKKR